MEAKFKDGDRVKPSKRGKSYWENVLGTNFKGKVLDRTCRFHGRWLYRIKSGSYQANLFSYELEKRRSK